MFDSENSVIKVTCFSNIELKEFVEIVEQFSRFLDFRGLFQVLFT